MSFFLSIAFLGFGQKESIPQWNPESKRLEKMLKKLRLLNHSLDEQLASVPIGAKVEMLNISDSSSIRSMESDMVADLKEALDSLAANTEFAMGQEETIKLSKQLNELKQELKLAEANLESLKSKDIESLKSILSNKEFEKFNQTKGEYNQLFEQYKGEFESLDESLDKYILEHPEVKALQQEYLKNKALEANAFDFRKSPEEFQTLEKIQETITERIGGTKEDVGKLISEKIGSATEEVSKLKEKVSNAKNTLKLDDTGLKRKQKPSFSERFNFSTNFSFLRGNPASADFTLNIGYKLGAWVIGGGTVYRLALGSAIDKLDLNTMGWGYRTFTDYNLSERLFVEFAYESYSSNEVSNEESDSQWKNAALIGLGVNQPINKTFNGQFLLFYNIKRKNSQFSSPFIVRFGIGFNKKK